MKELPHGVPVPEKCFASPLKRALDTWKITFDRAGDAQVLAPEARKVLILEVRGRSCASKGYLG